MLVKNRGRAWRQDIWISSPALSEQSHQYSAGYCEIVLVEQLDRVTDPDGDQARVWVVGDHLHATIVTVAAHSIPPSGRSYG